MTRPKSAFELFVKLKSSLLDKEQRVKILSEHVNKLEASQLIGLLKEDQDKTASKLLNFLLINY